MSGPTAASTAALHDLASRIYVQIITDAIELTDKSLTLKGNPDNIARVSYKLAAAFQKVEAEQEDAAQPKSTALDVGSIDFGS